MKTHQIIADWAVEQINATESSHTVIGKFLSKTGLNVHARVESRKKYLRPKTAV